MKKVISRKVYDTETAGHISSVANEYPVNDFSWVEESLYKKRNGEYFLYGQGGARTRYAVSSGGNSWEGGAAILPLSFDEARTWAEENLEADEYIAEFGEPSEGETAALALEISAIAKHKLDQEASKTGKTRTAIIEELLMSL